MFGFGRRKKLIEIGQRLKGKSLVEVIEEFADEKFLKTASMPYNKNMVQEIKKSFVPDNCDNHDEIVEQLMKICSLKGFNLDAVQMYETSTVFAALKFKVGIELRGMSMLMTGGDEAKVQYIFDSFFGKELPYFFVLLVLFPPESNGRVEKFGINTDLRNRLIEEFFSLRLSSDKDLKNMVNAIAAVCPYFRDLPL